MPLTVIWIARNEDMHDQVGIKTDKYYFSFLSTRAVRDRDFSFLPYESIRSPMEEPGSLIFSEALDTYLQDGRLPDQVMELRCVTDDDINTWYEDFLKKHIVIGDRAVDHATVADILDRKSGEEAQELIRSNYDHFVNFLSVDAKVQYSLYGHVVFHKPYPGLWHYLDCWYRFYDFPQHSVTFVYNIIVTLDNYRDLPFKVRYGLYAGSGSRYYLDVFNAAVFTCITCRYFTREKIPPPDYSLRGVFKKLPIFGYFL